MVSVASGECPPGMGKGGIKGEDGSFQKDPQSSESSL